MKAIVLFLMFILSQQTHALEIHDVHVSAISENAINISLNTEAVELYYFNSWQYSVSGNTITLDAFYVEGFGSTIVLLNNNFEIPIDTLQTTVCHLVVQVYYIDLEINGNQQLQDALEGTFSFPIIGTQILGNEVYEVNDDNGFPNPCHGELILSKATGGIWIYNISGVMVKSIAQRVGSISLQGLPDGLYYIRFYDRKKFKPVLMILKKE
ncbi:MAG TPA: T9SS type A sorting domain-containing protein [Flavobacterium sp.]|nr:T9SS type A sorting domain-containing protein [Flavobacterium sp.]